eukprot:Sdes_comp15747_c0_seq1m4794
MIKPFSPKNFDLPSYFHPFPSSLFHLWREKSPNQFSLIKIILLHNCLFFLLVMNFGNDSFSQYISISISITSCGCTVLQAHHRWAEKNAKKLKTPTTCPDHVNSK